MKNYLIIALMCFSVQQLFSQCEPDRHTTDAIDGWISCEKSQNPKNAYGTSHWVRFDLGSQRSLHDIHLWNINHPDYLDDGIRNMLIDISSNGTAWTQVDTFTIARANGSGFYTGSAGPDLAGINARYVLLTALDNHGGGCVGLSEIKIYTEDYTPSKFELSLTICQDDGIYQNLSGGRGIGTYSGRGVSDQGDGTFDFDVFQAGPGVHEIVYVHGGITEKAMIEVLSCESPVCNGCGDCPLYDQLIVDADPVPVGSYYGHELNSKGDVANSPVFFYGGNSVDLLPGFEVRSSGVFEADIRACYNNMLSNPGFENEDAEWTFSQRNGATATLSFNVPAPYAESKSAKIQITSIGQYANDVNLQYRNLSMAQGRSYAISFYAKANGAAILDFRMVGTSAPYTSFLREQIELKTHWKKYMVEFIAPESRTGDLRLDFRCGGQVGTIYFDEVSWAER